MLKQLSQTGGKFKGPSHAGGGINTMNGIPVKDQLSSMSNIEVEGKELINTTPEGFTISPKDDPLNPEIERLNMQKGLLEDKLMKQSMKMAKAFDKRSKKKNDKELDDREKSTLEFLQSDSGLAKKIEGLNQQIQSLVAQQEESIPDNPEMAMAKHGMKFKAGDGFIKNNLFNRTFRRGQLKSAVEENAPAPLGTDPNEYFKGQLKENKGYEYYTGNFNKPFAETKFGQTKIGTKIGKGLDYFRKDPLAGNVSPIGEDIRQTSSTINKGIEQGIKKVGANVNKMLDNPNALSTIGDLTSIALDAGTNFQGPQAPVQQRTINANLDPISQTFASAQDRLAQESATLGAGIQGSSRSATENNSALIRASFRSGVSDLATKEAEALAQESARAQTINAGIDEGNVNRISAFQDAGTRFVNELSQRRTSRLQRVGEVVSANRNAEQAKNESFTNLAGQDPQSVLALFENNVKSLADTYFKGDTKQAQRYLDSLRKQIKTVG